jgi:hypothetical protein
MALISSTDPSWRVQNNGTANINTATANQFVTGFRTADGVIHLDFAPVPEPGAVLSTVACAAIALSRRARRIR